MLKMSVSVLSVCIIVLIFQSTSSQYVRTEVNPNIVQYGKDELNIQCHQENLQPPDSVYSIALSKIVNDQTEYIVKIESDISNPPNYFQQIWFSRDMMLRSETSLSQLVPSTSAQLVLFVGAKNVSCRDGGIYQCEIMLSNNRNGKSRIEINVTVPESTVKIVQEAKEFKESFDLDEIINLKCIASLSIPGCIRWCIKKHTDQQFEFYNVNDIVFSKLSNNGCQFYRYSMLQYKISTTDVSTSLRCEVSTTYSCGFGAVQDEIIIRNTKIDLVIANVTSSIAYKKQGLQVSCLSKQLGPSDVIQRISLSRIYSKLVVPLLGGAYNETGGRTDVSLHQLDFTRRTSNMFCVIKPKSSAILNVEISPELVNCEDSGIYRCEIILNDKRSSISQHTSNIYTLTNQIQTYVSSPIVLGNETLTITCATTFFEHETVNKIMLSKINGSNLSNLVSIELDLSHSTFQTVWRWHDKYFKTRVSSSLGNVHPANDAKLQIEIHRQNVLCSDAGMYTCEVTASNGKLGRSNAEVNITVNAERTFIIKELTCFDRKRLYITGRSVILKCSAEVGNPQRRPIWCRKLINESQFTVYTDENKIVYGDLQSLECQFKIFTVLEYTVTDRDTNTEFLCVVSDNGCDKAITEYKFSIRTASENEDQVGQNCYKDVHIQETGCSRLYGYITAIVVIAIISLTMCGLILRNIFKNRVMVFQNIRRYMRFRRSPQPDTIQTDDNQTNMALSNLSEENATQQRSPPECSVCMDRPITSFFVPCGHTLCTVCALEIEERDGICHLCREQISSSRPLYQ